MKSRHKIGFILLIIFAIALGISGLSAIAFADDPAPVVASVSPIVTAPVAAVATPATVTTAPAVSLKALPAMPASHDAGSIITWLFAIFGALSGWAGWLSSELMAVFPNCKWNGWLHGLLSAFGWDAESHTLTVRLNNIESTIAEMKGGESGGQGA